MITIGIDPHKSSVTAVALGPAGRELGQLRLPVTKEVGGQLREWARGWPDRQWAVEGATGLGRGVAQLLAVADEHVLDVPAKLAARARLLSSAAPARPTPSTPLRSPPWPSATSGCSQSAPRATPWCCGCCLTAATTWSPSGPGP